ncbi:hypothetical protein KO116_00216 [Halomonas sp. KO116]|nr:hypothetical protein KO116_00216 [Halomonas sp. KO116]
MGWLYRETTCFSEPLLVAFFEYRLRIVDIRQ